MPVPAYVPKPVRLVPAPVKQIGRHIDYWKIIYSLSNHRIGHKNFLTIGGLDEICSIIGQLENVFLSWQFVLNNVLCFLPFFGPLHVALPVRPVTAYVYFSVGPVPAHVQLRVRLIHECLKLHMRPVHVQYTVRPIPAHVQLPVRLVSANTR